MSNCYAPMPLVRLLVFLLLLFLSFSAVYAQSYGTFIGNVVARWNDDGRTMTLTEPFTYVDPDGTRWEAPSGSIIDGASIPQFAWSIIGGPFEGNYRNPSVIHDVACIEKRQPWERVHLAFYTGMLASGVSTAKAKIMYAAVYHFGPRWPSRLPIQEKNPAQEICIFGRCFPSAGPALPRDQAAGSESESLIAPTIPPPPQRLTPEAFNQLISDIEKKEGSEASMTLDQIREYQQPQVQPSTLCLPGEVYMNAPGGACCTPNYSRCRNLTTGAVTF